MKKFAKMSLIAAITVAGFAGTASAKDFGKIYTECGLGAAIAPNTPVVAAITNVTWDLGTTAISSALTSEGTCAGSPAKVAAFISTSYPALEKELAQGEGQYLDTLVSMTKPADMTKEAFVASVRADFAKVAGSSASNYEKSEALYNIVTM